MNQELSQRKISFFEFIAIAAAGCLVYGIMQGVHDNYGIMMKALISVTGVSYDRISFIIGVGAILYGFSQPVWGALALKKSNTFVMLVGIVLIAVGLAVTPLCRHFVPLLVFFGIVLPCGTGALGSGIIMGAVTPIFGEKRAAGFSGILQASAGVGDAIMSPGLQSLIGWQGVQFGMGFFGVLIVATIPAVFLIGVKNRAAQRKDEPSSPAMTDGGVVGVSPAEGVAENGREADGWSEGETSPFENEGGKLASPSSITKSESLFTTFRTAFKNPTYRRIVAGFSTCGFNMSIIEAHLFSQFVSWGLPETKSSFIMTIYGILTMLGTIATGALSTRFKMKNVLGSTYFVRVVISLAMILFPFKGLAFAVVVTALLGMSGDSTVPPTMGLITREFGAAKIAVFYGIALAFHQIGAFLSAAFGGFCYAHFGNYTLLWAANGVLCLLAATASWSIWEEKN